MAFNFLSKGYANDTKNYAYYKTEATDFKTTKKLLPEVINKPEEEFQSKEHDVY